MRPLLFIVPALPVPATTGGEIFNQRLVDGLSSRWKLSVVTLSDLGLTTSASPDDFADALRGRVEGAPPGPVFVDTYLYRHFAPAFVALKSLGFGPFIGFGQAWYPGRYRGFLSRLRVRRQLMKFLRCLDHHVVVSNALKGDYVRQGIDPRSVDVALPGFDLLKTLPLATPRPGPLRVRMAGTYMEAKGQHLLVQALELLTARIPDLINLLSVEIMGPKGQAPDYVRSLEARAGRLPQGLLTLTDSVSQSTLWRAFSQTDVFVFPASGEGLGMVVVEAMLCGAYPVVSPDGPLREVVGEDDQAGRVIPRDAKSLAEALLDLARDPALPMRRRAARERARLIAPSWDDTIGRVSSAIARVAVSGSSGRDGLEVGPSGQGQPLRESPQADCSNRVASSGGQARPLPQ